MFEHQIFANYYRIEMYSIHSAFFPTFYTHTVITQVKMLKNYLPMGLNSAGKRLLVF